MIKYLLEINCFCVLAGIFRITTSLMSSNQEGLATWITSTLIFTVCIGLNLWTINKDKKTEEQRKRTNIDIAEADRIYFEHLRDMKEKRLERENNE